MSGGLTRRGFLRGAIAAGGAFAGVGLRSAGAAAERAGLRPLVVSTWKHGVEANKAAWAVLAAGGTSLDAVEKGVNVSELDPNETSVGYGGLPNAEGEVELDASIMWGPTHEAGSVASLRYIKTPVSVARRVMEATPHVLLVGDGALRFAVSQGFKKENLLTERARQAWEKWQASGGRRPYEGHDTIGMVVIDSQANVAGACTTSGLAWKLPGRVGDSPLIGHGLYVDQEVGGAAATGVGEEVIRICGSARVVEGMRRGLSPRDAIRETLAHLVRKSKTAAKGDRQVAFVAMNAEGEVSGMGLTKGFQYALTVDGRTELVDAEALLD